MNSPPLADNRLSRLSAVALLFCFACPLGAAAQSRGTPWSRHVVDDSSRGADGVRLCEVNADGLPDVVTGWEQGGITRAYLQPPGNRVFNPWPAVTVGRTPNVEDAVFVDLDEDGRTDVVSCCEGHTRTVFVHWAPADANRYLDPDSWRTEPIPASKDLMMWMFSTPVQIDGRNGLDLVAGGKGADAQVGWFEAPEDARELDAWKWHSVSPAGWIMSLRITDLDGDGDPDVLLSDRKGPLRGCRWLENPGIGPAQSGQWRNHFIGGRDSEVMFLTVADLDADDLVEVLCAVRGSGFRVFSRQAGSPGSWTESVIEMPPNVGTGKAVEAGDVDRDGDVDLVFSCENAKGDKSGVMWLCFDKSRTERTWTAHEISGSEGIKFDRLELIDLDADGDLDVLACEESEPVAPGRQGLGVFWYENPTIKNHP